VGNGGLKYIFLDVAIPQQKMPTAIFGSIFGTRRLHSPPSVPHHPQRRNRALEPARLDALWRKLRIP